LKKADDTPENHCTAEVASKNYFKCDLKSKTQKKKLRERGKERDEVRSIRPMPPGLGRSHFLRAESPSYQRGRRRPQKISGVRKRSRASAKRGLSNADDLIQSKKNFLEEGLVEEVRTSSQRSPIRSIQNLLPEKKRYKIMMTQKKK